MSHWPTDRQTPAVVGSALAIGSAAARRACGQVGRTRRQCRSRALCGSACNRSSPTAADSKNVPRMDVEALKAFNKNKKLVKKFGACQHRPHPPFPPLPLHPFRVGVSGDRCNPEHAPYTRVLFGLRLVFATHSARGTKRGARGTAPPLVQRVDVSVAERLCSAPRAVPSPCVVCAARSRGGAPSLLSRGGQGCRTQNYPDRVPRGFPGT